MSHFSPFFPSFSSFEECCFKSLKADLSNSESPPPVVLDSSFLVMTRESSVVYSTMNLSSRPSGTPMPQSRARSWLLMILAALLAPWFPCSLVID